MDNTRKKLIKNFSYALTANITSLVLSVLLIVLIPRSIGVNEYGYYQLFLFYASYIGFLHLGHINGIYLKYGGISYNNINKSLFSSQFWILFIFDAIVSLVIYL